MAVTDVEISRCADALATTLNDQRLPSFDPGRLEAIVTGALGGEAKLAITRDRSRDAAGWAMAEGRKTLEIERGAAGRWSVLRLGGPVAHAYVPPAAGDARAQHGATAPHALAGTAGPDVGDPAEDE